MMKQFHRERSNTEAYSGWLDSKENKSTMPRSWNICLGFPCCRRAFFSRSSAPRQRPSLSSGRVWVSPSLCSPRVRVKPQTTGIVPGLTSFHLLLHLHALSAVYIRSILLDLYWRRKHKQWWELYIPYWNRNREGNKASEWLWPTALVDPHSPI